ncbi:MAG TPA: carbonic anhydrase, partial [Nocardioides sp.]
PHTRCAVASNTEAELRAKLSESAGQDASWLDLTVVVDDQARALAEDVAKVRSHPFVPEDVKVGGFIYDVDTGLLNQKI